ncbi:MAG: hypothetical protein DI626_11815 [Micavibrio aeruginosavorus]|uniref:N-acetyltransferase domain-containing protein n=1 Tax=Micavibrio aeruginosavorus TaxID=349221 RepID=A0A2W4Z931_9BACT|nr:MAG: hypothetical protein DI626_11815 [Micavibrio aeruginosavorus]
MIYGCAVTIILPKKASQARPISLTKEFERVDGRDFAKYISELCCREKRFADNLSVKEDYSDYHCWLLPDGSRGFAVGRYFELTNVFSRISCGDKARGILDCAKSNYENLFLNCFAGKNEEIYKSNGFVVTRRESNWEGPPHPDVVHMQWSRSP